MPKIPTFKATGSIEQLQGVTTNIQINPNNNLASALSPLTEAAVNYQIKENDVQNRTEALKLENDYNTEALLLEDQINQSDTLSTNKNASNIFLKEKTNALIEKYAAKATNRNSKSMFQNSALREVQKQIFSIDGQISNNILLEAGRIYEEANEKLFSRAYDKKGIYLDTLENDSKLLINNSFKNILSAPKLEQMLSTVKPKIQMFNGLEMVRNSPEDAYFFIKNSENLPDITNDNRFKLLDMASKLIRPQLKAQWENRTAIIALGKEPSEKFNMELAKEIMGVEVYQKMIQEDTFTKDRVANNSVIYNASNDTVNEVVKGIIDEGNELYEPLQALEQENYYNGILQKRKKNMKEDIVKYITDADDDIELLYEQMNNDENEFSRLETRKLITESLIKKQKELKVEPSLVRITTKKEINNIIFELTNPDTPYLEKKQFIDGLSIIYGTDNMDKVLNHLQDQKLPIEYIVAMSTNSEKLTKDILSGETTESIAKFVKDRLPSGKKFNTIEAGVAKGMEDFETVILNQGEGSKSKTDYLLSIQEAVYKSALIRVRDGESIDVAVDGAVNDFNKDYKISPEQTFLAPADVNGKFVNQMIVFEKAEALQIMVENTDYIDRFHGEDGYMHYATLAGIDNLTEEQVKERINFTIKNHSKWLNNADMTGAILYAEFANGTHPIVNANGDKIEFSFTDQPNDKGIYGIELKAPVTGEDIELTPYQSDVGAYEFEEVVYDDTSENKNLMTTAIDGISTVIDTAGDVLVSSAAASEMSPSIDKSFEGYIKTVENNKLLDGSFKNFRHKSKEGGLDTIAFGHKLTKKENKNNKVYQYDLSEINSSTSPERILEISNDILRQDLKKTEKILITTHGNKFINLDSRRKQMLIDMQFNVREFNKPHIFKNFKKALFAGDEEGMKKEYIRGFYPSEKDRKNKTNFQTLSRNQFFKKYFLDK